MMRPNEQSALVYTVLAVVCAVPAAFVAASGHGGLFALCVGGWAVAFGWAAWDDLNRN